MGGHCIAVDPWFIASEFPEMTQLIQTSRKVNLGKTSWVISQIIQSAEMLAEQLGRKPKVALFGLAYKPNVADLRESPAVEIAYELHHSGHSVICVEPHAKSLDDLTLSSAEEACQTADLWVMLVKHDQFCALEEKLQPFHIKLDFCGLLHVTNN